MPLQHRTQTEWLDQGAGTLADARANLNDMWRLNRLTGGVRAVARHLLPHLNNPSCTYRIADIGAGSGLLARFLADWASRHRIPMQVYAVDRSARHLALAQENTRANPAVRLIQGDGTALPFAPQTIDFFVTTLFMHHFDPDALIEVLRHTFETARRGIVMSDVTRGLLPQIGLRLIHPIAAPHPFTLHDGLLSIQRAYTPDELTDLARAAGLTNARVYRHPLWRMTLVAEKPL